MYVMPIGDATAPAQPGARRSDRGAFADALQRQLAAAPPVTMGEMVRVAGARSLADPVQPPATAATAAAGAGPAAASATAAPAAPPVQSPAPATAGGGLVVPVQGRFSSKFGMRVHPVTGVPKQHTGIDLAAPTGTPIRAAAAGTVSFAGSRGGYGNLVILDHADGSQTYYAHQHRIGVTAGAGVAAGAVIGTVGSTGMSTGPHLHFEVRRGGRPVDPAPLLGLR